jgi:thiol-disulfide isomerase/thioredoxin
MVTVAAAVARGGRGGGRGPWTMWILLVACIIIQFIVYTSADESPPPLAAPIDANNATTNANNAIVPHKLGKFFYDGTTEVVTELHTTQEVLAFLQTPNPLIINFYASWCPHCQKYVSSYVNLAEDNYLKNISFGAINCVVVTGICEDAGYNITGFPTLKYFNFPKEKRKSLWLFNF